VDAAILRNAGWSGEQAELGMHQSRLYYLKGDLSADAVEAICTRLLCDPVSEKYEVRGTEPEALGDQKHPDSSQPAFSAIEILPKPGVMDPVAISAKQAIREMGFEVEEVRTARRYTCEADLALRQLRLIAEKQLANTLIEQIHYSVPGEKAASPDPFVETKAYELHINRVSIRDADDVALVSLSKDGHLFLNVEEMRAIRDYYRRLDRDPTDVELEMLAQTWSEHCVHKTLKSKIIYLGASFPEIIDLWSEDLGKEPKVQIEHIYENLLADTIAKSTQDLNKPWCLSVFVDNAGIIEFDDCFGVAFKVETHNHPSALEPYGGAATGIGGVIRDIMGCGLGAKPIANTDVFCFADPAMPFDKIPAGVIHPARSMREVVRGVRDYGNRMGIPTVNGAIVFDDRYLGNPLVYCGCVGLIPKNRIEKHAQTGDRIIVVGGRTGRDGIHGATFSSGAMTDTHADEFAHAVQIGNAITEKAMLDAQLQARDFQDGCLYRCVTDCGAGGLSSAVGEMGEHLGARVDLEKVPLKYEGLRYDEIWISEAQERMVLAVAPEKVDQLFRMFAAEDVETTDIGEFASDGRLELRYQGELVGELDMEFLHHGLPSQAKQATWNPHQPGSTSYGSADTVGDQSVDLYHEMFAQLSHPNLASKEWVIRQYDHEVQGGSVIKPLMGPQAGPADGAVVRPLLDSSRALALSVGLCPHLSDVDPYIMAAAAIDEAVRNNICVGGDLRQMAILDNFCWGGVTEESELGALVRACQGCYDAAMAYGIPFISGKDSLNNVFELNPEDARRLGCPQRISIPHTLLISAISVIQDVSRCRSSDLSNPGNLLLMVEPHRRDLAGMSQTAGAVSELLGELSGIRSCHDVSEGGLLVSAAEMALGSQWGLDLVLSQLEEPGSLFQRIYGERVATYLLETTPRAAEKIIKTKAIKAAQIGEVIDSPEVRLQGSDFKDVSWQVEELRRQWRKTFNW